MYKKNKLPDHIRATCADDHPLIYESSSNTPKDSKVVMYSLNVVGWSVWIYLWKPFATIFAWYIGYELAHHHLIYLEGFSGFKEFVTTSVPFGVGLCFALVLWAIINLFRFRGKDRRNALNKTTAEMDAKWTKITSEELENARKSKRVVCHYDSNGNLIRTSAD